jgi:hypothetical protein
MAAVVQIEGASASDVALQQEAMALARLLQMQPELAVELPDAGPIAPGQRGGLLGVGRLLLSTLAPEGVQALIEGLKLYVARSPEFTIAVTGESGARIEVSARNLAPEAIAETAGKLRELLAPRT